MAVFKSVCPCGSLWQMAEQNAEQQKQIAKLLEKNNQLMEKILDKE